MKYFCRSAAVKEEKMLKSKMSTDKPKKILKFMEVNHDQGWNNRESKFFSLNLK